MRSWNELGQAVDATTPAIPFLLVMLAALAVGVVVYLFLDRRRG